MGDGYPKRGDYEYIKKKSEAVFFDPKIASKEIVDRVFESVNDRNKLLRTLALAKSAIRHNMANELPKIKTPTAIIWGKQDTVTPPNVAKEFHELLPDSNLYWIDKCGHAPMMEHPEKFNTILENWLELKISENHASQIKSLIISNTDVEMCPKNDLPEYAFIGRSNVGKSSLINSICNKKLAKTSSTPGKTILINHYLINESWYLVDLPGYGYARLSKIQKKNKIETLIKNYFKKRKQLINAFLLIDIRHQPQNFSLEFMLWLNKNLISFQ